jgi:transporter family protein
MSAYLFAVLAMVFWGLAPVFAKVGLVKISPVTGLYIRTFFAASVLLMVGALTGQIKVLATVNRTAMFYLAGEVAFASLLGHLAYFYALKYGTASRMVPLIAAYPLITFVVALSFLGEKASLTKGMGAVLVVLGLVFLTR